MKIYIIDECIDRVGGVERVICTLANKLVTDNEVTVISENKSKEQPFYKYDDKVNIKYLNKIKIKSSTQESKNIIYYCYKILEKIIKKITLKNKIKKISSELNKADVIIFGRIFTAIDFMKHLKINKKTKIIVRDAINLEYYNNNIKRQIKKYFNNNVDYLIVSSDESMKIYSEFFENQKINIVKIYNPLGIIPNTGFSLENKKIISIGRLDIQKGYDYLIEAFSIVSKKYPDWKLEIYGDGLEKDNLDNLIEKLNLKNNVSLLPSNKNVVDILNTSSIFVLTSRYEGYANILVEALSCGVPSISYNWLTGVEEIIDDNVNGLIVKLQNRKDYFYNRNKDSRDIVNLANAIEKLIINKDLCKKFSTEAPKIIKTRNNNLIIEEWMKLIKS